MEDILARITANKLREISLLKQAVTPRTLQRRVERLMASGKMCRSMRESLLRSSTGIIAEYKRKSPSLGWIKENSTVAQIAPAYAAAGASALSILTDRQFFGGELNFLSEARTCVDIPLLRKDFMLDEYQLYEARLAGADVVLLIASCLQRDKCHLMARRARSLGMEVLLEVHNDAELDHISDDVTLVGINNRNLRDFKTNIETSYFLGEKIPDSFVKISESGLHEPKDIVNLREVGFRGFLMGERFMKEAEPGNALHHFIDSLKALKPQGVESSEQDKKCLIKVCGMRDADNIKAVEQLGVDMMGFIFYPASPRYVATRPDYLPEHCKRVGVFVDATIMEIKKQVTLFNLDYIQLHGHESPAYCALLCRETSAKLIKTFSIRKESDFAATQAYISYCSYFLFDTPCEEGGGSGRTFDWSLLDAYHSYVPFFLSGGIGIEQLDAIKSLNVPQLAGIDLNSRFEVSPAQKDVKMLSKFIEKMDDDAKTF